MSLRLARYAVVILVCTVAGLWVNLTFTYNAGRLGNHTLPGAELTGYCWTFLAALFCCRVLSRNKVKLPIVAGICLIGMFAAMRSNLAQIRFRIYARGF